MLSPAVFPRILARPATIDCVRCRKRPRSNTILDVCCRIPLGCGNEARIVPAFRAVGFDSQGDDMSRNEVKRHDPAQAVITAAYSGDTEAVIAQLDQGADLNARDCDGDTALILAADRGHIELVQVLVERGADVNAKNQNGETALLRAAGNGRAAVVKLLLAHQADRNAGDIVNCAPLMRAAYRGHVEVVKELLACGVDTHARNSFGNTAATLAARSGHSEIVEMLREAVDAGLADQLQPKRRAAKSAR